MPRNRKGQSTSAEVFNSEPKFEKCLCYSDFFTFFASMVAKEARQKINKRHALRRVAVWVRCGQIFFTSSAPKATGGPSVARK